jgi:hypothetical protein
MPIDPRLTKEDIEELKQRGIDPEQFIVTGKGDASQQGGMTSSQAAGATLKHNAGGILGGGAGTLSAGALLAPWLIGPEAGIPADLLMLGAAGLAGAGGGYVGQKAQQALQSQATNEAQEQAYEEAQRTHPLVSAGTDIAASALASGGSPSLSAPLRALSGEREAIKHVLMGAVANPAINSGIQYATTGEAPSLGDVASQAGAGLLFGGNKNPLGRIGQGGQRKSILEPEQEQTADGTPLPPAEGDTSKTGPYYSQNANGYLIDDKAVANQFSKLNPKPKAPEDSATSTDYYQQDTAHRQLMKLPIDQKRAILHDNWMKQQVSQVESTQEPLAKVKEGQSTTPSMQEEFDPASGKPWTGQEIPEALPTTPKVEANVVTEDPARLLNKEAQPNDEGEGSNKPTDTEQGSTAQTEPASDNRTDQTQPASDNRTDAEREQESQDLQRYNELQDNMQSMVNSGEYLTPEGYLHPEYHKMWSESVKLTNKNSSMSPKYAEAKQEFGSDAVHPDVHDHILNDPNATTGSVIGLMASREGKFQKLAKVLSKSMDPESAKVPWSTDLQGTSKYETGPDKVTMALMQSAHAPTILHEAIHSMTASKLPREWEGLSGQKLQEAMDKFVKENPYHPISELVRCYNETAHALGSENAKHYGMQNLHEFIAEAMSRKEFQDKLNSIKTKSYGKTIWQRVVDAVSKLLGVPINKSSMLERVLHSSAELISQKRGEQNAIQKQEPSSILQHTQKGIGEEGSQRRGMEQSIEGKDLASEGGATHNAPPITPGQQRNVKQVTGEDFGKMKRVAGSVLDNVRALPHKGAKILADAMQSALDKQQLLLGKYKNPSLESAPKGGFSKYENGILSQALEKMRQTGIKPSGLAPRLQKWVDQNHKLYDQAGKEAIAAKVPVKNPNGSVRLMRQDPKAWPTMANQRTDDIIRQGTNLKAIAQIKQDYVNYQTQKLGKTPAEAESNFNAFKAAQMGTLAQSGMSSQDHFNAIRRAMGDPLSPSLRENDEVKNMSRYFDRYSTALSHYTEVEKNHKAMAALGAKTDAWGNAIAPDPEGSILGNKYVKTAVNEWKSEPGGMAEQTEGGLSSLFTQMFIQHPGLQAHVLVSNVVGAASCAPNPYVAVRTLGQALTHMKEGWAHAKENGLYKMSAVNTKDMFDNSLTTYQRMAGMSKAIRDISTLGGLTTKANAAFQQAYFEHLVPTLVSRANQGDEHALGMLKHWDASYKQGKSYSPKEVEQLASVAASYIHGTGDIRQMPAWMMQEGEISGFMQLAHWSTAQTNNFMHNFVIPAQRGNYTPLMTAMFGAAAGGYLVKELREALQGKKGQIPSLQEIAAGEGGLEGHPGLLAYNMIAGMQYAGFGGLFSQVAKYPFDMYYKNSMQTATFPLDEVASDFGKTIKDVGTAIANDPQVNWVDLASAVALNLFRNNLKLSSVAINHGINAGLIDGMPAEKKELADKMGQLRRFEMVQGIPYNEVEEGSNPYMNLEQKKFKMTQDLGKAVKMLPELINSIVTKYKDNPDVMMNKLEALKTGSQYTTFPSFEKLPMQAMKYIAYLQREEGPEQAQAALRDYLMHKTTNEIKGSLIP